MCSCSTAHCRYSVSDISSEPKPASAILGQQWDVTNHTAWKLADEGNAFCSASAAAPCR